VVTNYFTTLLLSEKKIADSLE